MLLYYITDRSQLAEDESRRRTLLLAKVAEASRYGVDFIQLRENDLSVHELELLANEAAEIIRDTSQIDNPRTRLLINSRTDVAVASSADGVHLRSGDVPPSVVRQVWPQPAKPVVTVACHSVAEVARAAENRADFAVFAPIFEKKNASPGQFPTGLDVLRLACKTPVPVIALGGITLDNAKACIEAGAVGIAGIRLFQNNKIEEVLSSLRNE